MKKILALVMAGAFVLGSLGTAAAVDIKVKGQWDFSYGYYTHRAMYKNEAGPRGTADNIQARMRARTQIEFIASESLSALLHFEIGDIDFGSGGSSGRSSGGSIDADGVNVETKRAHLDFIIPQTDVKIRMGLQGIFMPTAVFGMPVLAADVAGVSVSTDFNDIVGITGFWARPYDSSATDRRTFRDELYINANGDPDVRRVRDGNRNAFDEMDLFGIMVPIKTEDFRITPWGMIGFVGKDANYWDDSNTWGVSGTGSRARYTDGHRKDQAFAWWAGAALELPILDPWYFAFDGAYGAMSAKNDYKVRGYILSSKAGYKWSWGKTGIFGWYNSGDSDSEGNGNYGTIPIVSDDTGWKATPYGFAGQRGINRRGTISDNGIGTWGFGAEVAEVSFVKDLAHTLKFAYIRGTNQGDALGNNGRDLYRQNAGSPHYSYLITSDSAYDVSLENVYQMYPNLTMALDFSYTKIDLSKQRDSSVRDNTVGSFASMLSFQYKF